MQSSRLGGTQHLLGNGRGSTSFMGQALGGGGPVNIKQEGSDNSMMGQTQLGLGSPSFVDSTSFSSATTTRLTPDPPTAGGSSSSGSSGASGPSQQPHQQPHHPPVPNELFMQQEMQELQNGTNSFLTASSASVSKYTKQ